MRETAAPRESVASPASRTSPIDTRAALGRERAAKPTSVRHDPDNRVQRASFSNTMLI
jgi:hypothetical protein